MISKNPIQKENFINSLALLNHRGPDNYNSLFQSIENNNIALGHTRLGIIDLNQTANQPFNIGGCSIIYNGEIYNFKNIKEKLNKDKVNFVSNSDTETILQSYIKYGLEKTLSLLDGMYSFIILDKKKKKLFIVRDRIGIKPLYYFTKGKISIFSSEIKSILKLLPFKPLINPESLANYFYHRYVPEPKTIYKDILAVNSGEYIEINIKNNNIKKKKYWKLKKTLVSHNENTSIDRIDELLNKSVEKHLISDVPLCFGFSGGLDSSLLIAIAKKYTKNIFAYTIKRSHDDIDWLYSKKIAKYLNIKHSIIDFNELDLHSEDKRLYEIYDQPIGCSSIYSTYLLNKVISKDFKVCICGDGSDEIFGGYTWYKRFIDLKSFPFNIFRNQVFLKQTIKDLINYLGYNDILRYKKMVLDRYDKKNIEKINNLKIKTSETNIYKKYFSNINSIKDLMYADFHTFLKYNLIRADLSSMAHSVEVRVPFLDHALVEYSYSLNHNLFYKNGETKYILKKVAERYLPNKFIYRPKKGFSSPIENILPVSTAKEAMNYIFHQWKKFHY